MRFRLPNPCGATFFKTQNVSLFQCSLNFYLVSNCVAFPVSVLMSSFPYGAPPFQQNIYVKRECSDQPHTAMGGRKPAVSLSGTSYRDRTADPLLLFPPHISRQRVTCTPCILIWLTDAQACTLQVVPVCHIPMAYSSGRFTRAGTREDVAAIRNTS